MQKCMTCQKLVQNSTISHINVTVLLIVKVDSLMQLKIRLYH